MNPAPTRDELHALIDAQLDESRAAAVLAWLRQHPDDAWTLLNWQVQAAQLRRQAQTVAAELPAALPSAALKPRASAAAPSAWLARPALAWAFGAALLLVGALVWQMPTRTAPAPSAPAFVRHAGLAHAVFVPEKRHPVEVKGAEEAHLVQWLSKRLGRPLQVPDLRAQGYQLLGGRLLPGDASGPSAQFMFENAQGARLTLYVSAGAGGPTAFHSVREGTQTAFYWIDRDFGYALLADAGQPLPRLARAVYEQLSS